MVSPTSSVLARSFALVYLGKLESEARQTEPSLERAPSAQMLYEALILREQEGNISADGLRFVKDYEAHYAEYRW